MTARESLLDAAKKLLPGELPGVSSSSVEELDLRFLETSEALVLSLLLDPDAPYYLTKLIISETIRDLDALRSDAKNILDVLRSPIKSVPAPEVDRNFQLADEAAQRVGSRVAAGAAPEAEDLRAFVEAASSFAEAQLLPHEQSISADSFRASLLQSAESIKAYLPALLARLKVLQPSNYFVDQLDEVIPRSKQLSVLVERIQKTITNQRNTLTTKSAGDRAKQAPVLLAETATLLALVNVLSNVTYLRSRVRVSGNGSPASNIDGTSVGSGTAARIVGTPIATDLDTSVDPDGDPFLSITAGNNSLIVAVDDDGDGAAAVETISLSTADAPADIIFYEDDGIDGWLTSREFAMTLSARVSVNGAYVRYTATLYPIQAYDDSLSFPSVPFVGEHLFDRSDSNYKRWDGASWVALGTGDPTITRADYAALINSSRTRLRSAGADGPLVGDVFLATDTGTGLSIALRTGAWRSVGRDVSITVVTNGSDISWEIPGYEDRFTPRGVGPLYASGTCDTSAPNTVTDLTADFVGAGVLIGHLVRLALPSETLLARITAVTATELVVDATLAAHAGVVYEVVSVSAGNEQTQAGTSPLLTDIVDDINAAAPDTLLAEVAFGRRLSVKSKVTGATAVGGSLRGSKLQVIEQPITEGSAILGLPSAEVFGTTTCLYDPAGAFISAGIRAGMPILFSTPIVDGSPLSDQSVVAAVLDEKTVVLRDKLITDPRPVGYSIYAAGALSYADNITANAAAFESALRELLQDTAELDDLLGRAVFTAADRRRAEDFVVAKIGDLSALSDDGPATRLRNLLSSYDAPTSDSLTSAIRLLRERGFSQAVDLLLAGEVASAFELANASYTRSIRRAMAELGITL